MPQLRSQLRDIVFDAIDELNSQRAADARLAKSADTVLAGENGGLDSLAFVTLVVNIEQRLDERLGLTVNFFDDEQLDLAAGPFRTVQTLLEHLERLVSQEG